MAVVFISPRQRQKMFFLGITAMFLLLLVVISLGVFMSKPSGGSFAVVFNRPKVNIDMSVFSTDQFKNLLPLPEMQIQYNYTATDQNKKQKSGFIMSVSIDQAKADLEAIGLVVNDIKEAEIGRTNPFTPYYQKQ
ncbi:MAG: hypothetical protein NTW11_03985 [Candidatus Staskawiczbacteria bacterium]|nr:hypothetical protein [Candidatus Staskawiczbacteria bacterium]